MGGCESPEFPNGYPGQERLTEELSNWLRVSIPPLSFKKLWILVLAALGWNCVAPEETLQLIVPNMSSNILMGIITTSRAIGQLLGLTKPTKCDFI